MKKIYIVLICVFITIKGNAQAHGISYQALIINPQDEEVPGFNGKETPLANKEVCLRFSFLDSSNNLEYQEIQKIKTDEFGMVNLMIGMGKYSSGYTDSFKNINWDGSTKRLKVEVDVKNDCREFEEISNQVLAYVPFAFYALNSPASKIPGPKGDTGLGIKEVKRNQDTLYVKLTNDSIINLGNIKGNKGDQGIQGPMGITGNNGTDGVSITNAKVDSDSLKITLSNGTVINSGYVKGNKGDTGVQGKTGSNGISVMKAEVKKDSLWIMLSDSSIQNAGYIKGNKGDTGISGTNGISVTNSQVVNDSLKIILSNGTIINAGYVKGNIGAQGPQGVQGLTGSTGPQGATGTQGPAGANGISVTNSQVINDSLKVTLSDGTIINAGHVKGNIGAQGPQGIQGLTGSTGPQGAIGTQGPAGANGISVTNSQVINDSLKVTLSDGTIINAGHVKGNIGAQGPQGIQGLTGSTGPQGANGAQGPAGANGINVTNSQVINDSLKVTLSNGTIINAGYVKGNTGAQGPQGIQGLTGAPGAQGTTGATGAQGPAGTNGISVTNSQVINDSLKVTLSNGTIINAGYVKGNTGPQGLQGLQGLTGATGLQGPAGTNGISVTNSQVINDSLKVTLGNGTVINAGYVKGNTGAQGPQGIQGLTGATGLQGPAGTNGISVTNSQVINDSLKVTLSNGTVINAGYVKGNTGAQGPQGFQGLNPLIKTTNEPAGVNCSDGGVKIEVGLDTNRNNVLDNSEINSSQTKYVCNATMLNNSLSTINGTSSTYKIPDYLHYCGDGSNGNRIINSKVDYKDSSKWFQFNNLRISLNGEIFFSNGNDNNTLFFYIKDTLEIIGKINLKGKDTSYFGISGATICSNIFSQTAGGAGGGHYNGGSSSGIQGQCTYVKWSQTEHPGIIPSSYYGYLDAGIRGTTICDPISSGESSSINHLLNAIKVQTNLHGGYGSCPIGKGGCPGGGIYIICKNLIFSGIIDTRGGNSKAFNVFQQGGGGGGGGSVVISAENIISNTGTILINGGFNPSFPNSNCLKGGNGAYLMIDR